MAIVIEDVLVLVYERLRKHVRCVYNDRNLR